MIIHHAGGLHVGIANGGAEEFEAALFHVLADSVGYGGACGEDTVFVVDRLAVRHKAVEVFVERAEFFFAHQ